MATLINVEENTAKSLFSRLITMDKDVEECMKIMSFWIWLQPRGFPDIISKLSSSDDKFLDFVSGEADVVLAFLKKNSSSSSCFNNNNLMHLTVTNLAQRFLSPAIIFADKEKALKGIMEIYSKVCCVIFEDTVKEKGKNGKKETVNEEIVTDQYNSNNNGKFKLNPFAKEWNPEMEKAPESDRCLFLTFSNGFPLTERQITNFFTEYGDFMERVYIHWPNSKNWSPPLFGKVVFKASNIPIMVLNGQKEAKFWVDGKPLWCKKFDPEKQKKNSSSRNF